LRHPAEKDLWKRCVLSFEWKGVGVVDGESGGDEAGERRCLLFSRFDIVHKCARQTYRMTVAYTALASCASRGKNHDRVCAFKIKLKLKQISATV